MHRTALVGFAIPLPYIDLNLNTGQAVSLAALVAAFK
jgi:hypothetical protein